MAWRQAGRRVTLVSVVETWGSAPRPPMGCVSLCREALLQLTSDQGARTVVAQHPAHRLDVDIVDALIQVETRMQKSHAN